MTAAYDEVMRSWKRAGRDDAEDLALHLLGSLEPGERDQLQRDLADALAQGTRDERVPRALAHFPGPTTLDALRQYVGDVRDGTRPADTTGVEATLALARLTQFDQDVVQLLLRLLSDGASAKPRLIAAFELRNAPVGAAVRAGLTAALADADAAVRRNAADSLLALSGATGADPRVRRTLSMELHSASGTLRQRALADLSSIGTLSLSSPRSDDDLFALIQKPSTLATASLNGGEQRFVEAVLAARAESRPELFLGALFALNAALTEELLKDWFASGLPEQRRLAMAEMAVALGLDADEVL